MLNEQTIAIIKSTVPVLEQKGIDITKRFYERLFINHPELLNVFNHINQKQEKQQGALANVVYAAALNIERLEVILPTVKQIAHKHRSLGIKPEQYPIVGENLIAAIKEVLGDAATDEILNAWTEAYGVIADVFISIEQSMYEEAEKQQGGWADFRAFVVDKKVVESDVITSFYFVPQDGGALAQFEAGQYISIKAEIPGEKNTHIRQYSLSDASGKPYYRISVKREDKLGDKPAGIVSSYLHDQVEENDVVWLSAPAGEFTLDRNDDRPVVLLSGGVGLTPMISMVNTIAETQPNRPVIFVHAAINSGLHAMRNHMIHLAQTNDNVKVHFCYERPTNQDSEKYLYDKEGYIDQEWLSSIVPEAGASYYFCGPTPFMKTANRILKSMNVPDSDIHYEFFGPAGSLMD